MDARQGTQRLYGRTVEAERFCDEGVRRQAPDPTAAPAGGPPSFAARRATRRLERTTADGDDARFHADALLGVGATGQVYSVLDRTLERMVAVKVLLPDLLERPEEVEGFLREARITAALTHPNVLPVHDFELTEDGRPYIAMARIQGRSLGALLAESSPGAPHPELPGRNALVSMTIAVCNAAAFAHHQGILHQDIKPDNIMLGDFGEVLLVDWGSAGRMDADGRLTGRLFGTPLYMSPEQARREWADRRSDVYCIGATLFHALTLRLPCWRDDPDAYWAMKRSGEIDAPTAAERAAIPAELLAIALKALAPDPEARYQTAEDLRRDLEQYQAGLAVSAHRDSWWRRFRRWHRRNAKLFWVSAVAAAAVAAAAWMVALDKLAERGAWSLVLAEDFHGASPSSLDARWRCRVKRGWHGQGFADQPFDPGRVEPSGDGIIFGDRSDLVDVSLREPVLGDLAVEWDYRPLLHDSDLDFFLGASDRDDKEHRVGLTFHNGGFGQPRVLTLTRGDEVEFLCEAPLPSQLRKGVTYHFRLERAERHMRLSIDGRMVVDWFDAEAIGHQLGQRFGFDCVPGQRLWVGNVRVYHRLLAQRVSPIEVGDHLFQVGAFTEAAEVYAGIREAYAGVDDAARADFRLQLCAWRQGRDREALAGFARFAAEHVDHELAPYAQSYRARIAEDLHLADERQAAREALKRYRGHPLLAGMVHTISGELTAAIPPDLHGTALVERVAAAQREVASWERDYGIKLDFDRGIEKATKRVLEDRLYQAVLTLPRPDRECVAHALREMGRLDEALARTKDEGLRDEILFARGDLRPLADDERTGADYRMLALYRLGELERMRRVDPRHPLVDDLLIYEGHADRYLELHPVDGGDPSINLTARMCALLAAGRGAEAASGSGEDSWGHFIALLELGRLDEACVIAGSTSWQRVAAVALAAAGQLERAKDLEAKAPPPDPLELCDDDTLWNEWVFPALLAADAGDLAGARARLQPALAEPCRWRGGQRPWHILAYALGAIDEAGFRAQPSRLLIEPRRVLAQALRLELAGDARAAARRWRDYLALPHWQREVGFRLIYLVRWRLRQAGVELPPGPIVPTIGLPQR